VSVLDQLHRCMLKQHSVAAILSSYLKSNNGDEFASLRRAYKGEEGVSRQEIKKELISAIQIMQSKLDRLTHDLH
jgi:hypothetical protein